MSSVLPLAIVYGDALPEDLALALTSAGVRIVEPRHAEDVPALNEIDAVVVRVEPHHTLPVPETRTYGRRVRSMLHDLLQLGDHRCPIVLLIFLRPGSDSDRILGAVAGEIRRFERDRDHHAGSSSIHVVAVEGDSSPTLVAHEVVKAIIQTGATSRTVE